MKHHVASVGHKGLQGQNHKVNNLDLTLKCMIVGMNTAAPCVWQKQLAKKMMHADRRDIPTVRKKQGQTQRARHTYKQGWTDI